MTQLTTPATNQDQPERGLRGFVHRHPVVTFLLIFNTFGPAVALVPVVAHEDGAP